MAECGALILAWESGCDRYSEPNDSELDDSEQDVQIGQEVSVSKIESEQRLHLICRGLTKMDGSTEMQGLSPVLFALNSSRNVGQRVADSLGLTLSPHEERDFEDGEHSGY